MAPWENDRGALGESEGKGEESGSMLHFFRVRMEFIGNEV